MIYFDAFGRGRSDRAKSPSEYSFERDLADLGELPKALGFKRMNLYGFSYGGMVAQAYALRHPEHVSRLVLSNALNSAEMWQAKNEVAAIEMRNQYPEAYEKMRALRDAGVRSTAPEYQALDESRRALLWLYDPTVDAKLRSEPGSFNPEVYRAIGGADADVLVGGDVSRLDFRGELAKLRMPVLVLAGRFDRVFPPRSGECSGIHRRCRRRTAGACRHGRILTIPLSRYIDFLALNQ